MTLNGLRLLFERKVDIKGTPVPRKLLFVLRFGPQEYEGMGGGRGEPSTRVREPRTQGRLSSTRLSFSVLPASSPSVPPPHALCGRSLRSLPWCQRVPGTVSCTVRESRLLEATAADKSSLPWLVGHLACSLGSAVSKAPGCGRRCETKLRTRRPPRSLPAWTFCASVWASVA